MITADRYEPWHYEYLAGLVGSPLDPQVVRFFAEMYRQRGDAYTIRQDGNLIGCAGVLEMWPGVAEAWTLLTDEAKAAPFWLHTRTKSFLLDIIRDRKYHRVQAIIKKDDPAAIRWIECLGFTWEADLKRFNPDQTDACMYVFKGVSDGT